MRISFAVTLLAVSSMNANAVRIGLQEHTHHSLDHDEQTLAQQGGPANVVVIDQSRSAFGGGNLAGPHIMDSVSKALARSFGSNPSAGPAPAG